MSKRRYVKRDEGSKKSKKRNLKHAESLLVDGETAAPAPGRKKA